MMTTRDACDNAWVAVLRGTSLGMALLTGMALNLTGCATIEQNQVTDQAASQSVSPAAEEAAPPKLTQSSSYLVKGKRYQVEKASAGQVEKGTASWYGKRFHGRRTSSGERFDMHAMTAAHKNLPLASLIQVTNLDNGLSAVVRVNDRGPFHAHRVLDLSYAAASQLDMVDKGSARVRIQVLDPAKPDLDKGLQEMFVAASEKARAGHPVQQSAPTPGVKAAGGKTLLAQTPVDILGNPLSAADTKPSKTPISSSGVKTADLYLEVGAFGNRRTAEALRQDLVAKLEAGVRVNTDVSDDAAPYQVQVGPLDSQAEANDLSRKLVSLGMDTPRIVSR